MQIAIFSVRTCAVCVQLPQRLHSAVHEGPDYLTRQGAAIAPLTKKANNRQLLFLIQKQ